MENTEPKVTFNVDVNTVWPPISARFDITRNDICCAIRESEQTDELVSVLHRMHRYMEVLSVAYALYGDDVMDSLLALGKNKMIVAIARASYEDHHYCNGLDVTGLRVAMKSRYEDQEAPVALVRYLQLISTLIHFSWMSSSETNIPGKVLEYVEQLQQLAMTNNLTFPTADLYGIVQDSLRPTDKKFNPSQGTVYCGRAGYT